MANWCPYTTQSHCNECFSFALAFSGYFHKVFVCTTGAAEVSSGQTQWIHTTPPISPTIQSLWTGHETGNYFLRILYSVFSLLVYVCPRNDSLLVSCLLVEKNVSKFAVTIFLEVQYHGSFLLQDRALLYFHRLWIQVKSSCICEE